MSDTNDSEDRLQREAHFQDTAIAQRTRTRVDEFYIVIRTSDEHYRKLTFEEVAGKQVLEYGCSGGEKSLELACRGAHVAGIDISPVAVEIAGKSAREQGLADRAQFYVMDAEHLEFPNNSFDVIFGSGILHHLDLNRSCAELARVLRPGGRAVFLEPFGHNPFINIFRRRTPELRTTDEHPLLMKDIDLMRHYFSSVNVTHYHLTSLASILFRKTPLFHPLYTMTEGLDRVIFTLFPFIRPWGWMGIIVLEKT